MLATALFADASTGSRWVLAAAAFAFTTAATCLFHRLGRTIVATGGPGYDAFQRAGSAAAVAQARAAWGRSGLRAAREAWTLDLVYPVSYAILGATLASLAETYAAAQDTNWLATAMGFVSWLAIAAGATDLLVENTAVAVGLWSTPSDAAARIAKGAGLAKITLIAIVAVALFVALVVLVFS